MHEVETETKEQTMLQRSVRLAVFSLFFTMFGCDMSETMDGVDDTEDDLSKTVNAGSGVNLPLPAGARELPQSEFSSLFAAAIKDIRYDALDRAAQDRHLRLNPSLARGIYFPKGYTAVFVPVVDNLGSESGFLANSGTQWVLSLVVKNQGGTSFEGIEAMIDSNGRVSLKVSAPLDTSDDEHHSSLVTPLLNSNLSVHSSASMQTTCSYVKRYWFADWLLCLSFPENPFNWQYETFYRFGWSTYPNSQWWNCAFGTPHICPQFEAQGSPFSLVTCGNPPFHPQG